MPFLPKLNSTGINVMVMRKANMTHAEEAIPMLLAFAVSIA